MAKIYFDIKKCEPHIKEQRAQHNVDEVQFCALDNVTYKISGLELAFPDVRHPIVVGPANCTLRYKATGPVGKHTGKITGDHCPHERLPEIIIDINA